MNDKLLNRATSGFPLSIGTSMALETLFDTIQPSYDETRVVERLQDLGTYNLYVFNTATLLRNIIQSVQYSDLVTISKQDIYDTLLEEIEFLTQFFDSNSLNLKFYVNTYQYVKDVYKEKGSLRQASTDKQFYIDNLMSYCLDKLKKNDDVVVFYKDIRFNREDRVLLFTHVVFDLLSYNNFLKLDLLESHTGKIKSRKDWWTKYHAIPNVDMSFLPLMEYLLSVFGDNYMFKPAAIKDRMALYKAMQQKGITPLSSELTLSFMLGKG
jgi:hypothetical protein